MNDERTENMIVLAFVVVTVIGLFSVITSYIGIMGAVYVSLLVVDVALAIATMMIVGLDSN